MSKQFIWRKTSILFFMLLWGLVLRAQERGEEQKIFNFKCNWVYNSGTKITHDINKVLPALFSGPNVIEADPGDKILFYEEFIDVDNRKNCSTTETISCASPSDAAGRPYQSYKLEIISSNPKSILSTYNITCVNDFDVSGSRQSLIKFTNPVWLTLPSASDWTSDINLTITLVDFGYDPEQDGTENFVAPETGTTKDAPYSIKWTIKKRTTPCPVDLLHLSSNTCIAENVWYPDPLACVYQADPALGSRPSYEGLRIEESFSTYRALGFTLSDIKPSIVTAYQSTHHTADDFADLFFGSTSKIGTFIIQEYSPLSLHDIIVDEYSGFGKKTPFIAKTAFSDADGVGWEIDQYYKCNGTIVRTNVISGRSFSPLDGVQNFKKFKRK